MSTTDDNDFPMDDPNIAQAAARDAARDAAADPDFRDDPADDPLAHMADDAGDDPVHFDAATEPGVDPVQVLADRMAEVQGELLRAVAETENVRKRGERMVADAHKFAATGFAKDLLSVADNLQRALQAVPAERRSENDLIDTILTGVEAVERELLAAFQRHSIEPINPIDTPFDPNFHQAMFEVSDSGKPAGTVVQVLQPGYVLNGRLLRPAMVGVAKGNGPDQPHRVDTTV